MIKSDNKEMYNGIKKLFLVIKTFSIYKTLKKFQFLQKY